MLTQENDVSRDRVGGCLSIDSSALATQTANGRTVLGSSEEDLHGDQKTMQALSDFAVTLFVFRFTFISIVVVAHAGPSFFRGGFDGSQPIQREL